MPAVPEWDVLLRGGVLRALGQRGCRSGWTVLNFRGHAQLHITARARDGHRKQLLLPYPWESDQLEAIRDGVVTVYEAFQNGAPLELSIAELSTAKAEAEAEARRQAPGRSPGQPALKPAAHCPTSRDKQPIDPDRLGRPDPPLPAAQAAATTSGPWVGSTPQRGLCSSMTFKNLSRRPFIAFSATPAPGWMVLPHQRLDALPLRIGEFTTAHQE
jgi:hypothetical protein